MYRIVNRKGSAILTAIGMGTVLMIIVTTIHVFSSYRVKTVVEEGKKAKALALAEAGLELALGELYANPNFATHALDENLNWGDSVERESTLQPNSDFDFATDSATSGTYSGTLGDGDFAVKVGLIPYDDNVYTKTIDESRAYIKIESLGRYDNTVRRVEAVVNRRYPAREFLMYDGGVLSLIFGQTGAEAANHTNRFSVGHLYGHQGVEISRIMLSAHSPATPGTKQELHQMSAIMSGAGGIYFYSPTKAEFINKKTGQLFSTNIEANCQFPTHGTYDPSTPEEFGGYPKELLEKVPPIPANLKNWIKDKGDGMSIAPRAPAFEQYKKEAQSGGLCVIGGNNSKVVKYGVTKGYSPNKLVDALYLDFGSSSPNIKRENTTDVPSNGIIYSDKNIVIKGNPGKDVSIVSEKNIFVAGDFNQKGDGHGNQYYGFPQIYDRNAMQDPDYTENAKQLLIEDGNKKDGEFRHHVAATVIAKERIVYDYRSPVDCYENELFPFLKYKIASAICGDEGKAKQATLNPNGFGEITSTAEDAETFKADFSNKMFGEYKLGLSDTSATLKDELESEFTNQFESSKTFTASQLHELTQKAWDIYKEDYEAEGTVKGKARRCDSNQPMCVLLNELRAMETSSQNDFAYNPEITVDGMFISCGKQNNTFYAGPDVHKYYNKIGCSQMVVDGGLGPIHSQSNKFIHRMYGSEVNMRIYDVPRISRDDNNYKPPLRRKIYDESLKSLGLENSKLELAGFIVLSWRDTKASDEDWATF